MPPASRTPRRTLGIDFGTSNSAAGFGQTGTTRLIELEPGQTAIPTTFFFDFDTRQTLIGAPANAALVDGAEGRFMRALKRVLGTSLMQERRQILNERLTFIDIIARYLAELRRRSEAETGLSFPYAISGRPVVFHGEDDPREAQALADLRACYLAAGFEEVTFLPEPQAAAMAAGGPDGIGLIVDIGGGTSDFSLFDRAGDQITILANAGIRLGGTDFDRRLSIDHVMPHLGRGSHLRDSFGPETRPMPAKIFNELATWEMIPFLYAPDTRRNVAQMLQMSVAPEKLSRLAQVLDEETGHDLAFSVERGKIAANSGERTDIDLSMVARGLAAPLDQMALLQSLGRFADPLQNGAQAVLDAAGVARTDVASVVYVGGSSLMEMVGVSMRGIFPEAEHRFGEVFTGVVHGLALAAAAQDS